MFSNCVKSILPFRVSGGSRISRSGGVHLLGGIDLRCRHFLVKMYAKTKHLGCVEGGWMRRKNLYVDPPMLIDRLWLAHDGGVKYVNINSK